MKSVTILAIESSADETSAAVFKSGRIASNIIYSQVAKHAKTDGIVPEVAAREHLPKIIPAIRLALNHAKLALSDLDAIAVTAGPGLITSLRIGIDTAKALAFALDKPIIPINHLEGHLLSAFSGISNVQFPMSKNFPALGLIVSGGHTLLVLMKSVGRYKILGETLDDAAGEAFDKTAKLLGLPYPGGPQLSRLAERGNPKKYDFPRALLRQKNYNFSFSGLKTNVLYFLRELRSTNYGLRADVAASVEQAIVDILVAKTLRAAQDFKVKTVTLGGGVAANHKLRLTLKKKLTTYNLLLTTAPLTTDNAGMIAYAAAQHYQHHHTTTYDKVTANPNLPLRSWR